MIALAAVGTIVVLAFIEDRAAARFRPSLYYRAIPLWTESVNLAGLPLWKELPARIDLKSGSVLITEDRELFVHVSPPGHFEGAPTLRCRISHRTGRAKAHVLLSWSGALILAIAPFAWILGLALLVVQPALGGAIFIISAIWIGAVVHDAKALKSLLADLGSSLEAGPPSASTA